MCTCSPAVARNRGRRWRLSRNLLLTLESVAPTNLDRDRRGSAHPASTTAPTLTLVSRRPDGRGTVEGQDLVVDNGALQMKTTQALSRSMSCIGASTTHSSTRLPSGAIRARRARPLRVSAPAASPSSTPGRGIADDSRSIPTCPTIEFYTGPRRSSRTCRLCLPQAG